MSTPAPPPRCPVHPPAASADPTPPHGCPLHAASDLRADNRIPVDLPNTTLSPTAPALSTRRTLSSIPGPRADRWVYPSPQQFYNALARKGWETPADHIDVMVDLHNQLNEEAWREVLQWEAYHKKDCPQVKLIQLQGRPHDISPKAWFSCWWYGSPRPFDRHDWIVDRCGTKVRYIIDYYSGPDEGETPIFYLDVRPALDSPTAMLDRIRHRFSNWWNAKNSPTQHDMPTTSSSATS